MCNRKSPSPAAGEGGPSRPAGWVRVCHGNLPFDFDHQLPGQGLEPGAHSIPAHPALAGESGEMPTPP